MAITSPLQHGLEIGRRALSAQQAALNYTGHNIANANTPGFSRREVNLEHVASGAGNGVGSGADVGSVVRQRSRFLDAQVRVEQQVLGRWEAVERAMEGIEAIFNEPVGAGSSETGSVFNEPAGVGLSGSLSRFWNAWQDLANVPESGAARAAVRQEGEFLTTTLNQYSAQLLDTRRELDNEVIDVVEEVNDIIDQLATLNQQIPQANFAEGGAADLQDRRDQLLEQLSLRVDMAVVEHDNGQLSVLLSGHNLIEADQAVHLRVRQLTQDGLTSARVFFDDDNSVVPASGGQLEGLVEARDEVIPGVAARLDELAAAMVTEINLQHRAGYGAVGAWGVDFFDPEKTRAASIALDDAILADLNNIAASADGNRGDNAIALAISGLRNRQMLAGDTATVDQFYNSLLGDIGARSKEAQTMASNHRLFSTQLETRRQGVQGVSLNEEAAQLVLYQRAYQAAARTVSIIDDLMEVTINI